MFVNDMGFGLIESKKAEGRGKGRWAQEDWFVPAWTDSRREIKGMEIKARSRLNENC
jgi:hypothetical protein